DKADQSSTFFRYTDERKPDADHEKSSWKERDVADIFAKMGPEHEPTKAFLLLGANDSIQHAYQYDSAAMVELSKAVRDTAKILSGGAFGPARGACRRLLKKCAYIRRDHLRMSSTNSFRAWLRRKASILRGMPLHPVI